MKFKGRNGGMATAIRNHIMLFRVFVISLLISIIPIMFFICAHNTTEENPWCFFVLCGSSVVFSGVTVSEGAVLLSTISIQAESDRAMHSKRIKATVFFIGESPCCFLLLRNR